METAGLKQRNSVDFEQYYENLCFINGSTPLPSVTANIKKHFLNINASKTKIADWGPILNALKINKTLEIIVIKNSSSLATDETGSQKSSADKKLIPAGKLAELVSKICKAIRDCIIVNQSLKSLELVGFNLRDDDVELLAKGLSRNTSLQNLSLERSLRGYNQLEIICQSIKYNKTLQHVNFSCCGLTNRSIEVIASYIKHQASLRHSEAWQDSLRYRKPELDRMGGLRRITINHNQLLGDSGVKVLCSVLRDDLWIKALDMHDCGLTNDGGKTVLEMMKFNTSLVVIDVRQNELIGSDLLRNILDQVIINCSGHETEYKWLKVDQISEKKQTFNQKKVLVQTKENHHNHVHTTASTEKNQTEDVKQSGIPWRTALRASRLRNASPEGKSNDKVAYQNVIETQNNNNRSSHHLGRHHSLEDKENIARAESVDSISRNQNSNANLKSYQNILLEEECKKLKAKVSQLTEENDYLRSKCNELEAKQNMLENDEILDSIESSFQQFHQFLDALKQMGLGSLVSMAGLDSTASHPIHSNISEDHDSRQNGEVPSVIVAAAAESHFNNGLNKPKPFPVTQESSVNYLERQEIVDGTKPLISSANYGNFKHGENETKKDVKTTSKFHEQMEQALKKGDNLLQLSSLSSEFVISDLVDNITNRINKDSTKERHEDDYDHDDVKHSSREDNRFPLGDHQETSERIVSQKQEFEVTKQHRTARTGSKSSRNGSDKEEYSYEVPLNRMSSNHTESDSSLSKKNNSTDNRNRRDVLLSSENKLPSTSSSVRTESLPTDSRQFGKQFINLHDRIRNEIRSSASSSLSIDEEILVDANYDDDDDDDDDDISSKLNASDDDDDHKRALFRK